MQFVAHEARDQGNIRREETESVHAARTRVVQLGRGGRQTLEDC